MQQLISLISKIKQYQESLSLERELDRLNEIPDVTTRVFEKAFGKFADKVSDFLQDTEELKDDEQFHHLRDQFQNAVTRYIADIAKAQAKEKDTERERTTPVVHTPREHTKFDLELPSFSGKPTEWRAFYDLFSSTLESKGRHLNDKEKRCLLLKAMSTEEAKETVLVHSQGEDGYSKAVQALINSYGSATIVYPHIVREFDHKETYSFDRDSFRRMRQRYLLNFESMKALKGDKLSQFLAAHMYEHFDSKVQEEWTRHYATKTTLPTLEEMFDFFEPLEYSLARVEPSPNYFSKKPSSSGSSSKIHNAPLKSSTTASSSKGSCPICKEHHSLAKCSVFLSYELEQRNKFVKDHRRCTNCLHDSHTQSKCTSPFSCRYCRGRHHSLLHRDNTAGNSETTSVNNSFVKAQADKQPKVQTQKQVNKGVSAPLTPPELYFVDTAVVNVIHGDRQLPARAALDSGSGVSLMTESIASQLKLPRYSQRVLVEGAYGGGSSKHYVEAQLQSLDDPGQSVTLKFSIIPKLKSSQPPHCKRTILDEPSIKNLQLADPDLGGPLDLIICSIDRCKCVTKDFLYYPEAKLAATKTIFGWTITGPLKNVKSTKTPLLQTQPKEDPLQRSLERLWELDQVPNSSSLTPDETTVVQHFKDTHKIESIGRYMVELPRILNPPQLGESRNRAIQRFQQNEKSLRRKRKLDDFNFVLKEYLDLDHAELVPLNEKPTPLLKSTIFRSMVCSKNHQLPLRCEPFLMPLPSPPMESLSTILLRLDQTYTLYCQTCLSDSAHTR